MQYETQLQKNYKLLTLLKMKILVGGYQQCGVSKTFYCPLPNRSILFIINTQFSKLIANKPVIICVYCYELIVASSVTIE